MKTIFSWLWAVVLCIGLSACSDDNDPIIEIPTGSAEVKLEEGNSQTVTFTVNQPWTASVMETRAEEVSWLTVSPENGEAGVVTLTISAGDNYTREERSAYVHILTDGLSKSIAVTQVAGITVLEDDKPAAAVASGGFFVVNEDWLGWDNGTVNYFKKEGTSYTPSYRVYRAANDGAQLGVTTQFATIWGENVYFCSKQGNRLVVADAVTLKKKAVLETLGGDGRSFVGVDDKKGYVGHGSGIAVFDIAGLELGEKIEGVSGQIGTMCLSGGRVFAISQSSGLYVINASTDEVEKTIPGSYYTLTCSKDGMVWVASAGKLVKVDPETLETEELDYPDGANVGSPWFAWNAGSLCASTQNNVLYWSKGTSVVKYDIETGTANTTLFTLGMSEYNTQLAFYGAGLRVDPLTDELILTVKHNGWADSGAYNWIYKLDANGQEIINFPVKGDNGSAAGWGGNAEDWDGKYFWFPAMPFFEDANKPQILMNQILLAAGEELTLDLNEKVMDHDNTVASIQKFVDFTGNSLVIATLEGSKLTVKALDVPGTSTCTVAVISNGVRVEKTIRVDVEQK